jgi:ATP-dependent helicase/nuclease subunit B
MSPELHIRFDAAVNAAIEGATVVTATTRASRMLLGESVRRLRTTAGACRTPDVLPLEALYQRLWRDAVVAGAASQALLSSSRTHALWRKVIAASRHSGNLLTTRGSARMAQDAWRVSQEYRIALGAGSVRGMAECEAFFDWSSLYKEACRRGGWIDSATLPDLLGAILDGIDVIPKHLVIYGFDALTPQTSAFCDALRSNGTRVEVISAQLSAVSQVPRTVSAEGVDDELHLAAAWARQKLITDPSQRVGIIVPRLRELCDSVEATFAEVLHPEEFLSPATDAGRAFEVAAGRPLDSYAMVRHALLVLRFTFDEVSIHDTGILLRSPYVGDPAEACARAMFDVALRKKGRPQYSAESLRRFISSGTQKLSPPENFGRILRQLANLRPPASKPLRPSEAAGMFNDVLVAAKWPAREPDSGEYQLGERWDDLLGEFASLDGFLPAQSAPALVDELARMAASASFRPENSGAPVQVMDEDEAAGCAFDALWVCGLNDDWPQARRPNPYLPAALQRDAGVPNLGAGEQHASAVASLARFSASAKQVVLSWARQEEDRELRCNRLLQDFASFDAKTIGTPPPSCAAVQRASAKLEYVDDEHAPAADPATLPRTGTNVLKYQAHCPFRAFAELRLGGEKLESPELGLDKRVRGKLVETALQHFWTEVRDSDNLRDLLPTPRLTEIVESSIDQAFQEHWGEVEDAWNERLRRLERERLRKLLEQWREVELQRTPFEVVVDEQQNDVEVPLGGISIHARVDRVDRVRGGGFVVIDYKSGRSIPSPSAWSGDRPDEPQLPLYVVDQLNQNREVSAVAFAHLSSANPTFKGYGRNRAILGLKQDKLKFYLKGLTFDEHLRRWQMTLDRLAAAFVAGEVKVDPKLPPSDGESTCDHCHLQPVCRVAEVSFVVTNGDSGNGEGDE